MTNPNDFQLGADVNLIFKRLSRIEAQLVLLSEKAGVPFDNPAAAVPADVVQMAQNGDRLGAIKRYRELTNASLEDARDIVNNL